MSVAEATTVEQQVDQANSGDRTPVVFVHGLWLLRTSWQRWADIFEEAGYAPVMADWPGDPATVNAARANSDSLAGKTVGEVADHVAALIERLDRKPAVVGHSFGGLFAQIIAGRGLSAATVAIDPAQFRGVLPLPPSALRSVGPILANPLNRGRTVALDFGQFRYSWANALEEGEAKQLFDEFMVPGPATPLFQAAVANLNPRTDLRVDTKSSERGPLLIVCGNEDHTVPPAVVKAAYKKQKRNEGVTEIVEMENRGHALVIDGGWREVADASLEFVQRFA